MSQLQPSISPGVVVWWMGVSLGTWYLLLLAYRLLFHPLSRYPGPLSAKLTGWSNWSHAAAGDRHLELYKLHKTHGRRRDSCLSFNVLADSPNGNVVRFAPDKISINTAESVRDIYGSRKANVVKADYYHTVIAAENGYQSTFTCIDRSEHAYKRRMLSSAFSEQAMRDFETRVIANIQNWIDRLGEDVQKDGWTKPHNLGPLCDYLVFDILTDLSYGRSYNLLTTPDMRYTAELIPTAVRSIYEVAHHPWARVLRKLVFGNPIGDLLGGQMVRDNKRFQASSKSILAERRKKQESLTSTGLKSPRDFFHYLFVEKDPETGRGYSQGELQAESDLLILAGADTTSTTLAASFFYLLRNPACLAKLQSEIRSSFPSPDSIRWANTPLHQLPYLRAVLDETLRQSPPVAAHVPRLVLPGGAVVDGTAYPAGTTVGVSTYALHHNEAYFPDPFAFTPERWIVDEATGTTGEDVARAQSAFVPFSVGARGCIGKNLAYMELSIALARAVWGFDWREDRGEGVEAMREAAMLYRGMEGERSEFPVRDYWVAQCSGPVVGFRRRTVGGGDS